MVLRDTGHFRDALLPAARAVGRPLSATEAELLATHYRLLVEWNRKINLTGLRDAEAIMKRHFLEPIAAAGLLAGEGRLVDLGSGNGFPAVPLRVLHPPVELVLVEASEKKSAFLWAVLRELDLRGSRVETRRVRARADLADLLPCRWLTLRAVRAAEFLSGTTPPLLEAGGRALFFVSREEADRLRHVPPDGLRFRETKALPSAPSSVVAVLEPS